MQKFQYYLGQDYIYLESFARAVALLMSKAQHSQTLEVLFQRLLAPIERPLHSRFVAAPGLSLADVQKTVPSPTNAGYANHMLNSASR